MHSPPARVWVRCGSAAGISATAEDRAYLDAQHLMQDEQIVEYVRGDLHDALIESDQEWAVRLGGEHRAAVAKAAEYGEEIDRLRAALAQITEHGPSTDEPEDACAGVAKTARDALYPTDAQEDRDAG